MMNKSISIPNSVVAKSLAGVIAQGYTPEFVLEQSGLPLNFLDDQDACIDKEDFNRLIHVKWDILQDEASGFLPRPLPPGSFAMMCHATITCSNLRRALLRSIRFFLLMLSDYGLNLEERGEEAILSFENPNPQAIDDSYFVISIFIIYLRWSAWLIDQPILLERVHFSFDPPEFVEQLEQSFCCRHYFNQPVNQVVFNSRFLSKPLVQTPYALSKFLASAPACLLTHYQSDNSFIAKVRRILQSENGIENSPLEVVSSQLFTTPQTLRRRLKEEGCTFQEIKDAVRRDKAIYHLVKKDTSISELVTLMGFSEPSAFNRAFKKWTGITPAHYRDTHQLLI